MSIDDALTDIVSSRFDAGIRLGERVEKDMIAIGLGGNARSGVVASPTYPRAERDPAASERFASARLHPVSLARQRGDLPLGVRRRGTYPRGHGRRAARRERHRRDARRARRWRWGSPTVSTRATTAGEGSARPCGAGRCTRRRASRLRLASHAWITRRPHADPPPPGFCTSLRSSSWRRA